jgi:hypothetical protein
MTAQVDEPDGLFDIDEVDGRSSQTSSSPAALVHTKDVEQGASHAGVNDDIELSRRAVPVVEVEEDVCSICLDEFTAEDPEQQTECE